MSSQRRRVIACTELVVGAAPPGWQDEAEVEVDGREVVPADEAPVPADQRDHHRQGSAVTHRQNDPEHGHREIVDVHKSCRGWGFCGSHMRGEGGGLPHRFVARRRGGSGGLGLHDRMWKVVLEGSGGGVNKKRATSSAERRRRDWDGGGVQRNSG